MLQVVLFTLSVLLASASGWGACFSSYVGYSLSNRESCTYGAGCSPVGGTCQNSIQCTSAKSGCPSTYVYGNYVATNGRLNGTLENFCGQETLAGCTSSGGSIPQCSYTILCNTQAEADSANCVLNPTRPECQTTTDTTIYYCLTQKGATGYISEIRRCSCKSLNGSVYQCNGKSSVNINEDCPVISTYNGTCAENGYRDGPQADSTASTAQCYAVIGSKCYMKDIASGNTFSCECDGSCNKAMNDLMAGNGCNNPYPQPEPPPDSVPLPFPPDDTTQTPPDSSGDDDKYMEVLNAIRANTQGTMNNTADIASYTQTTMDNTTDIKNILEGDIAIDVKHIRNSTENIDETTQSIDNQLGTTNTLLNQIKNKDFSPDIHFNPDINVEVAGDTNIINFGGDTIIVNADTAKAPFEILGFLKGVFGGDTTVNYDSTGWGRVNDTAKAQLDSALKKGDWVTSLGCDTTGGRKCDNSIIGVNGLDSAKSSLKATFTQLGDTLRNGAFGDSLANWSSKFTSGTISGSGSENCPAVISRNYHIELVQGAGFDLTLGRFLCQPLVGNTTGWALCRLLLRASVALACMWFLFHCATGFGGRGGDDD